MSHMLLSELSLNMKTIILGFSGETIIVERLKEMGLHPGLEVEMIGRAPFGGPILFRFGNAALALRVEEAECAIIQK